MVVAFLYGADRDQYHELMLGMENNYLKGVDEYPKTLTAAYSLLTNWKQDTRSLARLVNASGTGIAFNTARVRNYRMMAKRAQLWLQQDESRTLGQELVGRTNHPSSVSAVERWVKIDETEEDQDKGGDDQSRHSY
jgi:hypothetical protein